MHSLEKIVEMNTGDYCCQGINAEFTGRSKLYDLPPLLDLPIVLMNERAKVPTTAGNGYDLYYSGEKPVKFTYLGQQEILETGVKISLPEGYAAFFWDRSGLSAKHGLHRLAGLIDSNYVGQWLVCLNNQRNCDVIIQPGDRIVQFVVMPVPRLSFKIVDSLTETDRGAKGFGEFSGK